MLETTETSRMEQDEDNHDFSIIYTIKFIEMLMSGDLSSIIYFSCCKANSLQKSSAKQYISVTLASENIAAIVLNVILTL